MVITGTIRSLEERVDDLAKHIGNTPLYSFNRINEGEKKILGKMEWHQMGGSVKARPAYHIIRQAILDGKLTEDKKLLDASSGNTAIAYASIGAKVGIKVTICLPENASQERKKILMGLGAELIYTSRYGGTDDAQDEALRLFNENPDTYFYADQYNNSSNFLSHYHTTAEEIWDQTDGRLTHFVTGLGTTGSFTGISKKLKEKNPNIKAISLQPDGPLHGLEGWKHLDTAKVPGIYNSSYADDNLYIDSAEAYEMVKKVAKYEGLLISPSSAANLIGCIKVASETTGDALIVTLLPDNAEKYGEILNSIF